MRMSPGMDGPVAIHQRPRVWRASYYPLSHPQSSIPHRPPPRAMTIPEPWAVGYTPPNVEHQPTITAVLNAAIKTLTVLKDTIESTREGSVRVCYRDPNSRPGKAPCSVPVLHPLIGGTTRTR